MGGERVGLADNGDSFSGTAHPIRMGTIDHNPMLQALCNEEAVVLIVISQRARPEIIQRLAWCTAVKVCLTHDGDGLLEALGVLWISIEYKYPIVTRIRYKQTLKDRIVGGTTGPVDFRGSDTRISALEIILTYHFDCPWVVG